MSYILDALKKSEKERQSGGVPDPLTVQENFSFEAKRRRLWPYFILAVLLLNGGIFAWLLGPWHSGKSDTLESAVHKSEQKAQGSERGISENRRAALPSSGRAITFNRPAKAPKEKPLPRPESALSKPAADPDKVIAEGRQADTKTDPPASPQPAAGNGTAQGKKLLNVRELPSSVQQGLPNLSITTHLYSDDPSSRMIRMNGEIIREGQDLSPGLKLVEITSDGVILKYQNYRFHVGLR